jgi:hypothetical protein
LTFLLYVVTIGSFWVQPIRQIFDQDRAPLRRGKS